MGSNPERFANPHRIERTGLERVKLMPKEVHLMSARRPPIVPKAEFFVHMTWKGLSPKQTIEVLDISVLFLFTWTNI